MTIHLHHCPTPPPPLGGRSVGAGLRLDGLLLLAQLVSSLPLAALVIKNGADQILATSEGLNRPEGLLESPVVRRLAAGRAPLLCPDVREAPELRADPLLAANPDVIFLVARPLMLPGTHHCVGALLVMDTTAATPMPPDVFLGLDTIGVQAMEMYSLSLEAQRLQAFLPLLCHELNTPLNGLLGLAALGAAPQSEGVAESAEALLRAIQRLQDYVEITQGKVQFAMEEFPLVGCMETTLAAHARMAPSVHVHCDGPRDVRVVTDPGRLQQILSLLVENALKFTPAGGEVNVRATVRGMDEATQQAELLFEVQDTGVGIAAGQMGQLFKAFGVGDASATRQHGGMGLGLVIAKALCEGLRGEMWVEAAVPLGSRFCFTVHAAVVRRAAAPPAEPRSTSLQSLCSQASWDMEYPSNTTSARAACDTPPLILGLRSSPPAPDRPPLPSPAPSDGEQSDSPSPGSLRRRQWSFETNPVLSVLVVDDVPLNVKVMAGFLRRLGCSVSTASNGVEAQEALNAQWFDAVFTDVEMPLMDGCTLALWLRSTCGKQAPYIVGVSANTVDGNRRACLASGMNEFLNKPVRFEAVKRVVDGMAKAGSPAVADGPRRRASSYTGGACAAVLEAFRKEESFPTMPLSPTPPKSKPSLLPWASALLSPRPSGRRADAAFQPTPPAAASGPYAFLRVRQRAP
eukprot:EG_transcript_4945